MAVAIAAVLLAAGAAQAATRIVGGTGALPGSWPSIVALTGHGVPPFGTATNVGQFCGGTLIDPSWVLTAGHCTADAMNVPVAPGSIDVVAGITTLSQVLGSQQIQVDGIVRHPGFSDVVVPRNDVALLHLSHPVTVGPTVATTDLPSPTAFESGGARIAGWGQLAPPPSTTAADQLQEATVQLLPDAACASQLGYDPAIMRCAGVPGGGIDACFGDSGGPLIAADLPGNPLVGIVSYGNGSCAQNGFPTVYARATTFRQFIYGTIGVTVPGPPTALRVGPYTNAPVWDPPASNGGRPVTDYDVRLFRGPTEIGHVTAGPAARTVFFGGLTNGVRFRFTVTPFTAAGQGATATYAPPSFSVTPIGRPVVRHPAPDVTTVTLRLRVEPRTILTLRVLDGGGRPMTPIARRSRIAGKAPARRGGALTRTAGSPVTQTVTVAFRTPPASVRRARITVGARNEIGEQARRVVTVRLAP